MSFFCPHFDAERDACRRLRCACVPGRPGCVLRGKVAFLVPPEERQARVPTPGKRAAKGFPRLEKKP